MRFSVSRWLDQPRACADVSGADAPCMSTIFNHRVDEVNPLLITCIHSVELIRRDHTFNIAFHVPTPRLGSACR